MCKVINYIIKATEPFCGYCQNVVLMDDKGKKSIPYTELTYEDYLKSHADCILISCRKYDELLNEFLEETSSQPAQEITGDRFYEMLECLPPCSWYRGAIVEYFYVCERLTFNLVSYFCRIDDRYFEFIDYDNKTHDEVLDRIDTIQANYMRG